MFLSCQYALLVGFLYMSTAPFPVMYLCQRWENTVCMSSVFLLQSRPQIQQLPYINKISQQMYPARAAASRSFHLHALFRSQVVEQNALHLRLL